MVHLVSTPTFSDAAAAGPSDQQTRHLMFHHHNCVSPSAAAVASSAATPLGVILVSKDESAERVLFMYPFEPRLVPSSSSATTAGDGQPQKIASSTYAAAGQPNGPGGTGNANIAALGGTSTIGLPVKMLAPLLVAKGSNGNGTPFEIKVDNVRFAGFPWHISGCVHSLAVVFILRGSADRHIVDAFQRLSKKIAIAINTEQQRCNYLRDQIGLMQPSHDEYEALPDELKKGRCPYEAILEKSGLARHLRDIFEDVCEYGMVDVFVDDCIEVGFCVEPKALCHAGLASRSAAEVEATMRHIRPYHGLLFLDESIPSPDSNPFMRRFFDEYEPSRSFEELAHLSGLPISQMLQIVRHYLLWARAMLIYPICAANVYANAPQQPHNFRALEAQFGDRFGSECGPLAEVLEAFSPPCSLGSFLQDMIIYAGRPSLHMSLMVFLLRNHLLVQLHTFFFLLPPPSSHFDDDGDNHHQHKQQQKQQQPNHSSLANDAKNGGAAAEAQRRRHCGVVMPSSPKTELSTKICALVNDSRVLSAVLRAHTLAICARALHVVGVSESEVFDTLSAFLTVAPFLNGRHHMEDIIYRTQIERSTVVHILDTFSGIVCPFYCHDVVLDAE